MVEGQARSVQDKICIGGNRAACQSFDDIDTGDAGYVGEVKGYLSNTGQSINQADYKAVLFWTYLTEKYGTSTPGDPVEGGMNLMAKFWEESAANPGRDGITNLNAALAALGHAERFRDIWKDFAVANYAKDLSGPNVPAKYRYADMAQPGGTYGPVKLSENKRLAPGAQIVDADETVYPWAVRYYEIQPTSDLPMIDIKVRQDSAVPLYFTVLGIKGGNVAYEYNLEARNLDQALVNNGYDKVVLIVAGLESLANYRYSFNGAQPTLRIVSPTNSNPARVGDPAAPDKFRVAVEVLASDGTPLAGVDRTQFSFRVGNQDVSASNILTSVTIQGQQWFVVRAPGQPLSTQYDFQVRYGSILSATQRLAVNYTPRADADSILVIDRSGSMGENGKLPAAQRAASLYVESWRTGDQIGVTSFNESVSVDMPLTNWTDAPNGGSRATALGAINNLQAGGATAIGDALGKAREQLPTSASPTGRVRGIVLLSDGLEDPPTGKFDQIIEEFRSINNPPQVHAIAIGPDADRVRMEKIADKKHSNGTYQYVSEPVATIQSSVAATNNNLKLDLDLRYRVIATKLVGQQQFFTLNGPLNDGNPYKDTVLIPVENGAAELVLSFSDTGLSGNKILRDPQGNTVQETLRFSNFWRVPSPIGGTWSLEIDAFYPIVDIAKRNVLQAVADERLPPYLIHAALRSDVTMEVYFPTPVEDRTTGVPMPIIASLTDTGPIKGATFDVSVRSPTDVKYSLRLYDDGRHDDGSVGDGIYGNTFYQTGVPGSYNVEIKTRGISPRIGPFTREDVAAFNIDSKGDSDGDGLPDEWEVHYHTNPQQPDANADPDNDGSTNRQEWERGTNPTDSDSDDGGEADGTDNDPQDQSDDRIEPTWAIAYPGIGKVFVRYVVRPQYATVQVYKGTNPRGPFTLLTTIPPGTGIMTDTAVVNDTNYCYMIIARDAAGHTSAALTPSCTTPKLDPLAPHGTFQINNGANATPIPDVVLTLWASDTVDPEHEAPGDEILLPPDDSATSVTDMMISNEGDMSGGTWEPYQTRKLWRLNQTSGLAAVFVKYRDAAGNESDVIPATINVDPSLPRNTFLPLVQYSSDVSTNPGAQPDLVGNFTLTPDKRTFTAGEAVQITVTVTNMGTANAQPFWVDFYINPSQPPTGSNVRWNNVCGLLPCYGLAWYVSDGLPAGQSITLTSAMESYADGQTIWPGWFASGSADLYLHVDSWNPGVPYGSILEQNEANNRAEMRGLTVTGDNPRANLRRATELPPRPRHLAQ